MVFNCTLPCVATLICCSALAEDTQRDKVNHNLENHWRSANACGLNVAYMMLGLKVEKRPDYEILSRQLSIGPEGTQLSEIRDVLSTHGLKTEIVKATPSDLDRLPLPAVAHVDKGGTVFNRGSRGHYVVLIAVSKSEITFIDGSLATVEFMERGKFVQSWTSYLLVTDQDLGGSLWKLAIPLLALAGFAAYGARHASRFLATERRIGV